MASELYHMRGANSSERGRTEEKHDEGAHAEGFGRHKGFVGGVVGRHECAHAVYDEQQRDRREQVGDELGAVRVGAQRAPQVLGSGAVGIGFAYYNRHRLREETYNNTMKSLVLARPKRSLHCRA